jgi:hypothetical protein
MTMFKAGFAVALAAIGAIAALLGAAITVGALRTGEIGLSYGAGASAVTDTATRAANPEHFWRLLMGFGVAPLVLGLIAAVWGWRTLQRRS